MITNVVIELDFSSQTEDYFRDYGSVCSFHWYNIPSSRQLDATTSVFLAKHCALSHPAIFNCLFQGTCLATTSVLIRALVLLLLLLKSTTVRSDINDDEFTALQAESVETTLNLLMLSNLSRNNKSGNFVMT